MPSQLSRKWTTPWTWAVPLLAALACNACIVFVSTGPTVISGATIVFVAKDGRGLLVPSLRVTIVDVAGLAALTAARAFRSDGPAVFLMSVRLAIPPMLGD